MKYRLRSLMTFSIRDLMWLMLLVALTTEWWMERSRLLEQVRFIETSHDFEKSRADALKSLLDGQESFAKARRDFESNEAAWKADLKSVREAAKRYIDPSLPEGHLLGPALPNSQESAPTPLND